MSEYFGKGIRCIKSTVKIWIDRKKGEVCWNKKYQNACIIRKKYRMIRYPINVWAKQVRNLIED